ncbi:beta strand repeat-containing protein, partial [Aquirufa sp. ROCK-SH2]
ADANVTTAKIADANVTTAKIADLNVTNAKLEADAITTDKIKDGEVQTADIKDANVTTAKIASGGNDKVLVTDGTGTVAWLDKTAFGAVADMTSIEGAGTTASPFKVKDLGIVTAKIADAAVTTAKIADANVTTAKIADANVTTAKIADLNVTNAKLEADAITTDKIKDGEVQTADIKDANVTTAKIADVNVTTAKIADLAVTTTKIEHGTANQVLKTNAAGTATEWGKLTADNIIAKDLTAADASITVSNGVGATLINSNLKVSDAGITTAKIADEAVVAAKIADNAVITSKIADGNVTEVKLASDAVTSGKILDGTIVTADLGNNSISTDKIIDANVTDVKLATSSVSTAKIAADAVTTAKILDGTIVNADIADATITSAKIAGTIAIANGGTGATTATGALTNLGAEAVANKSAATDMGGINADDVKYPTQLAVKTFVENSLNAGVGTATTNALNLKEDLSNKSTATDLGAGTSSNTLYPSQLAVKTYVDTKLTATNAIVNLTSLPNISNNTILGNTTGATSTPHEIPVTGTGDVVLKTSATINTPTITSPVLNGTITGTAIVPVNQGGSGANMSTTAGYVKQASTGANFTTVSTIPVADVAGAVQKVNGNGPDAAGNVTIDFGHVTTGTLAARPAANTTTNGDIYVVSGDPTASNDGRTFISDGTQWNEVTPNQASLDARYLRLAGGTMAGNITMPTGHQIILTDAPASATDAANKAYVDAQITAATPDATASATGKIQLAGDLTGTAVSPEIAANKVTFAKIQTVSSDVILGRSSTGTGNIEALTTLPAATLPAFSGDVTTSAGSATTTIAANSVTLPKMQNLSAQSLLLGSKSTGGTGVSEITLGTGLSMSGSTLNSSGGTVTNVSGTTNRITVTNGATTPSVDISANYVGQSSITTLGTITTGVWNGTTIDVANGGTGATTLTGYVKGAGTSALTASSTIPVADVTGAQTIANKSTDATFASSSDVAYPSQLAVKTYVDSKVAASTPDATTLATGKIQLAGDLTGIASAPEVGIGKITSAKILDGTILVADIADDAIETAKIKNLNVTTAKIADGAITTGKINSGGNNKVLVTSATGSVDWIDKTSFGAVADNVTIEGEGTTALPFKVKDLGITNAKIGETITVSNGGTGATTLTGYVKGAGTSAMTASATIPVADVTGAQTTANLSADMSADAASTSKYPSVAAVETYVIANATPNATTLALGKIQLAGDLTGIATAPEVGVGKITSAKIADGTIATADIAASAVTSSIIADGTIATADLAASSVTNAKIGETITVANGGTGATTLTGYVKGAGTSAMTASATIPVADVTGAQTTANLSADISADAASTSKYPSVAAVETYVTANATPNATTLALGKIQLAGDLGGTATSPLVTKLQGTEVSSTVPTNGQVLKYNLATSKWIPSADNGLLSNSGTDNYLPKFSNSSTTLSNSQYYDNGINSGIGTTNPLKKFHLQAGGTSLLTSAFGDGMIFSSNNAAGTRFFIENLAAPVDEKTSVIYSQNGNLVLGAVVSDNGSTWKQVAPIVIKNSNGFVGINTTNPIYNLDVNGTARVSSTITASSLIKQGGTASQFLKADGSVDNIAYAPLASPTFTGTPAAPTATAGTNSTQIATTAFVTSAVAAATIPDATTSALGKIQLAGDLTGIATAPEVGTGKITSAKIADGTIATADLAASSVTNAKIGETITVANGGTGATTLTGYVKGTGTTAMTASSTIPVADVTGAQTTANLSADMSADAASTSKYPSVAAVENYVTANATPAATTLVLGKIQLAGDLGGTAAAPLVAKLQGTAVSSTAPTTNQLLQYDGTSWVPVAKSSVAKFETEEFTPTAGQTAFTLTNTPLGRVAMFVNGVRVPKAAVSVSGVTATYVPASNGAYALLVTDRVSFDYIY